MQYRKRPVVIAAEHFVSGNEVHRLGMWCGGVPVYEGESVVGLDIHTLEGTMRANIGDYIICGVKGEFYPCKPDIFDATYEPYTD